MITETGSVTKVEGDFVWVRTTKQSVCGRCSARSGCGQSVLQRFLGRYIDIQIDRPKQLNTIKEGDEVEIGIAESAVLIASLTTYGVPILFFVLGAVLGDSLATIFPAQSFFSMAVAPLLAVIGLLVGFWSVRMFLRIFYTRGEFEPFLLGLVRPDVEPVKVVEH